MLRYRIMRFMSGRYGSYGLDSLTLFLLVFSLVVRIPGLFIPILIYHYIIDGVITASFIFCIFRLLSRNIAARQKENRAFRKVFVKTKNFVKLQIDRIKDIKKYRYRKCAHCGAVLRLPVKKGKHTVKCPKCSERFEVKVLF